MPAGGVELFIGAPMTRVRLIPASVILLLAVTTTTTSAAVDPALLEMAPPDTKILFGIEVQPALSSPFGQYALSRMPDHGTALLQFAAATGFDVRRDLRELLLASSGRRGKTVKDGVILARGTFQIDKFMTLAGTIHAKISNYDNVPLITPADPGASAIAIIDSSTLAVGSESALKGVINRHHQKFLFSGPLAGKAQTASASEDAWVATVTPLGALIPVTTGPWPTTFMQAVMETSAGLRFDAGGVTLSAEALTHSANEAVALASLLKIVASMVPGSQAVILQNARFTTNGPMTRISLTIAEPDLEHAFPAPAQGRAAR
jgi:hypothetical protein